MSAQCVNDKDKGYGCAMTGRMIPDNFQLVKKPDGELVLQGYFSWECSSCRRGGGDWRDLPTVILPAPEKISRWKKICQSVKKFLA